MGRPKTDKIDIADYLAIEQEDNLRYEFHEGKLFAMAGGSLNHSDICLNISSELRSKLRKKNKSCKAFNSEMKIEVVPGGKYLYPDAGVSCPDHKESSHLKGAITNPRLVVEVISPSSSVYDQNTKFRLYFSMPSVKEYLIISQDEPAVRLYRRHGSGDLFGVHTAEGLESSIELASIEVTIPLADIYYGIGFTAAK